MKPMQSLNVFIMLLIYLIGEGCLTTVIAQPIPESYTSSLPFQMPAVQVASFPDRAVSIADFGAVAEAEGFKKVAVKFRKIAEVEKYHERRYRKLLAAVEGGSVFKKDTPMKWKCEECGYVHEGPDAPKVCPVCNKPQAYFELYCECY